jgi:hypothetical protein
VTLVESVSNPPASLIGSRQVQLGNLVVGSVDAAGVEWFCRGVPGWGQAGSTGVMTQRTYAHGGWPSTAFHTPGSFTLEGAFVAPSSAAAVASWDRLMGVVSLDDLETVTVTEGAMVRQCDARMEGEPLVRWLGDRAAEFDILFQSADPRRLSSTEQTASTGLESSTGGLTVPFTVPFTIGATVTGGTVSVPNGGNATAPAIVRFDGPCDHPSVQHVGQARILTAQVDVLAGQYLELDLDKRWARLNGSVARAVSGEWPEITPGANILRFGAASYEAAALMTVTWRDAYR